jgi:hypothetical protein
MMTSAPRGPESTITTPDTGAAGDAAAAGERV